MKMYAFGRKLFSKHLEKETTSFGQHMTNLNMFNVLLQNKNKKNKPTRIGRTGT
jgi:hypothetical protein